MPIYNEYDHLVPALDSVLGQTLSEIEVICVDDGSTDHSLEILKEYRNADSRVRIVTQTNAGPAIARNNGLRRARGEYVAFLDADDFYEPTFLARLYEAATRDNLDIAISRYDIYNNRLGKFEKTDEGDHADIYKDGVFTSKNEHPDVILSSTVGAAWNKLFSRKFLEQKELSFPVNIMMYEDVYFVVTALSLAERVGKVHEVLMHHRIHSSQARARLFRKYYAQVPVVYSRVREFLVKHGMYAPLSLSYLNLSASRCYKIFNLLPKAEKEGLFTLLHTEYQQSLGWADFEASDFESEDVFEFVSATRLYTYEQYTKKIAKGSRIVGARRVRICPVKKFFAALFGKKNKI